LPLFLYADTTLDCACLTLPMHPRAGKGVHCYMFGDYIMTSRCTLPCSSYFALFLGDILQNRLPYFR
jgi:hypothetical protein